LAVRDIEPNIPHILANCASEVCPIFDKSNSLLTHGISEATFESLRDDHSTTRDKSENRAYLLCPRVGRQSTHPCTDLFPVEMWTVEIPQSLEKEILWGCFLVVRSLCSLSPPPPRSSPFCPLFMGDLFAIPWVFLYATLLVCPPAIVGVMVSLATAVRIRTTALWTRLLSGWAARPPRPRGWPSTAPPPLGGYLPSF